MRFTPDGDGRVTALRYYSAGGSGQRLGHLWSASGTQLAEVTFPAGAGLARGRADDAGAGDRRDHVRRLVLCGRRDLRLHRQLLPQPLRGRAAARAGIRERGVRLRGTAAASPPRPAARRPTTSPTWRSWATTTRRRTSPTSRRPTARRGVDPGTLGHGALRRGGRSVQRDRRDVPAARRHGRTRSRPPSPTRRRRGRPRCDRRARWHARSPTRRSSRAAPAACATPPPTRSRRTARGRSPRCPRPEAVAAAPTRAARPAAPAPVAGQGARAAARPRRALRPRHPDDRPRVAQRNRAPAGLVPAQGRTLPRDAATDAQAQARRHPNHHRHRRPEQQRDAEAEPRRPPCACAHGLAARCGHRRRARSGRPEDDHTNLDPPAGASELTSRMPMTSTTRPCAL